MGVIHICLINDDPRLTAELEYELMHNTKAINLTVSIVRTICKFTPLFSIEQLRERSVQPKVPKLLEICSFAATLLYNATEYGFTINIVNLKSVYPKILESIPSAVKILYTLLWRQPRAKIISAHGLMVKSCVRTVVSQKVHTQHMRLRNITTPV